MVESTEQRNPIEVLAEEFIERQRRGECPTVAEYADTHPDLADKIRELFPTIVAMERLKNLQGCEVHMTHIPTPGDEAGLRRLGVNLTSDPNFSTKDLFIA